MNADLSRDEMVAQIRAAYARPGKNGAPPTDRLESMDTAALRVLHEKLARLATRSDLQGHSTETTQARREAAKARLKAALRDLKSLKETKQDGAPGSSGATPLSRPNTMTASTYGELGASLVAGQVERDLWINSDDIFRYKKSILDVLKKRLQPARIPAKDFDHLMEAVFDEPTNATVRTIVEISQLEIARVVRSRVLELPASGNVLPTQALTRLQQENVGTTFEPVVISDTYQHLPPSKAAEALAKLQAYAIDFDPDYVFVPDNASQIVGQFLVAELNNRSPSITLLWRQGRQAPTINVNRAPRVLYVTDLAPKAKKFEDFRRRIHVTYGENAPVRLAGLVASARLYEQLIQLGDTLVTYVSSEGGNKLPWDRTGRYSRKDGNHVFGEGADNPFTVPDPFIDPQPFLEELTGGTHTS